MDKKAISKRIKGARIRAGIDQAELARRLGLMQATTLWKYENGQQLPGNLKTWIKIAEMTNTTLDFLIRGIRDFSIVADSTDDEPPYKAWRQWLESEKPKLSPLERHSLMSLRFSGEPKSLAYTIILDQLRRYSEKDEPKKYE